jgi:hypothetical protein
MGIKIGWIWWYIARKTTYNQDVPSHIHDPNTCAINEFRTFQTWETMDVIDILIEAWKHKANWILHIVYNVKK